MDVKELNVGEPMTKQCANCGRVPINEWWLWRQFKGQAKNSKKIACSEKCLEELEKQVWQVINSYGSYRTANSVARKRGGEALMDHVGNYVAVVRKRHLEK